MIGGALARPCISYPSLFARGTIWDRYPYLLPNLFSAVTVFVGVVIGVLFLRETHSLKKHHRDRGREAGDYLASKVAKLSRCRHTDRAPEKQAFLGGELSGFSLGDVLSDHDELLPVYQTQESSPRLQARPDPEMAVPSVSSSAPTLTSGPGTPGFKTFTKPVIMNIVSYGILAL